MDGRLRNAFEQSSIVESPTPEALDGLGRALWWMGETEQALATRARAYTKYRKTGRLDEAARVAIWLAWSTRRALATRQSWEAG